MQNNVVITDLYASTIILRCSQDIRPTIVLQDDVDDDGDGDDCAR